MRALQRIGFVGMLLSATSLWASPAHACGAQRCLPSMACEPVRLSESISTNEHIAPNAHTVSANSETYEVYLPLANVDGRLVLRIMKPGSP